MEWTAAMEQAADFFGFIQTGDKMSLKLSIGVEGGIRFIWSDDLVAIRDVGSCKISRASHVEPTADGKWSSDMGPVSGPVLGPYETRGEALAAEVDWLKQNMGL